MILSDFIDSNDGAGFRHAVALEDRNAEPEEHLCNGRVESCAARDVEVNAVAENRTKLLADLFVKKSRNKRIKPSAAGRFYGQTIFSAEATPTDFDCPVKKVADVSGLLGEAITKLAIDHVVYARYRHQDGWTNGFQIVRQSCDGAVEGQRQAGTHCEIV